MSGGEGPRGRAVYVNAHNFAVLDWPSPSTTAEYPPVVLGNMVYIGEAEDILSVVREYHPTANPGEIARRLGVFPGELTRWIDGDSVELEPEGWWALLELRAEALTNIEAGKAETMDVR